MKAPEERFTDRVADYVKYRPDYPPGVLDAIREHGKLHTGAHIADLGSGTGIFSEMLLERAYHVHVVEPNAAMRAAAEHRLTRILKPGGVVGLVWNARRIDGDPSLEAYEDLLLERCPEYARVNHRRPGMEDFSDFFAPGTERRDAFDHVQRFPWEGFSGRVFSSSYVPAPQTPEGKAVEAALRALFDTHARSGKVAFRYETRLFTGRMN